MFYHYYTNLFQRRPLFHSEAVHLADRRWSLLLRDHLWRSIFRGGSIKKTAYDKCPFSEVVMLREPSLKMDIQRQFF
jgi:hypothetical protein